MARQQPTTSDAIKEIRGINPDRSQKNHEAWIALIKKGKETPEAEWPELPRAKKPSPNQNALIDLLMLVIQIQAKKHKITAAVIATRKQVANMILAGETSISDDWRGALVNDEIAAVIAGKLLVGRVKDNVTLIRT